MCRLSSAEAAVTESLHTPTGQLHRHAHPPHDRSTCFHVFFCFCMALLQQNKVLLSRALMPSREHAAQVKKALWAGGIQRANKPADKSNTPGMAGWQDMVLHFHASCLFFAIIMEMQCKSICCSKPVHAQRASCAWLMTCAVSDLCWAHHGG